MASPETPNVKMPDPEVVSATMNRIAERSQRLVQEFVERQRSGEGPGFQVMDPAVVGRPLWRPCRNPRRRLADPEREISEDRPPHMPGRAARR